MLPGGARVAAGKPRNRSSWVQRSSPSSSKAKPKTSSASPIREQGANNVLGVASQIQLVLSDRRRQLRSRLRAVPFDEQVFGPHLLHGSCPVGHHSAAAGAAAGPANWNLYAFSLECRESAC